MYRTYTPIEVAAYECRRHCLLSLRGLEQLVRMHWHTLRTNSSQAIKYKYVGAQECQRAVDQTFLLAICTPILVLAAAIAYALRPLSADAQAEGRVFVDKASGNVFEAVDGAQPERDRKVRSSQLIDPKP